MKINGFSGNTEAIKALNNYKKNGAAANSSKSQPMKSDSLELSNEARELQKFRSELRELPDTREELVAKLKKQIKNGTYKPDAREIADAIIKERLPD